MKEKTLTTDILIIGAGGAGLRSAIESKKHDADVLVVSKGRFPSGCNTYRAGGVMLAPFDKNDSAELFFEDTLTAGKHLNFPSLVRILIQEGKQKAMDLETYGLNYTREHGEIKLLPTVDCTIPRAVPGGKPYSGEWFKALVDETRRLDIPVLDGVTVVELIRDEKGISGIMGLEMKTDTLISIMAKSIVLCTGGAGNLFRFTSNDSSITGDGHVMAYKAGAVLSHLEFIQMRQCIIYPESLFGVLPPFDGFVYAGGVFLNSLYQRYMTRYYPEKMEQVTRAEISKCAQLEIMAGRHSRHKGVYGDLSGVPPDQLNRVQKFIDACKDAEFDPFSQYYEWAPASHHYMGGVVINEACETNIPGLFAAGEVVGGIQGANRMGGNALTETQVFGAISGKSAASYMKNISHRPFSPQIKNSIVEKILKIQNQTKGIDHKEIRTKVTDILSQYVGVIRNEEELSRALQELAEIKTNDLPNMCLMDEKSFFKISEFLEVENLLILGELMTTAAQIRTESRGAHQRLDCPETQEEWEQHIQFQLIDDPKTNKKPIIKLKGNSKVH